MKLIQRLLFVILLIVTNIYASQAFVERLYTNVLGRTADTSGLTHWMSEVNNSTASDVAKSFFNSQEFLNQNTSDTEFLNILYRTYFDREADSSGYNNWMIKLTVGGSREETIDAFARSEEFLNQNTSDTEFVNIAYRTFFNREADTGGYDSWMNKLSIGMSRDEVIDGFLSSSEFETVASGYGIEVAINTDLNYNYPDDTKGESVYKSIQSILYKSQFETTAEYNNRVKTQLYDLGMFTLKRSISTRYNADLQQLTIYEPDDLIMGTEYSSDTHGNTDFVVNGGYKWSTGSIYKTLDMDAATAQEIHFDIYMEAKFYFTQENIELSSWGGYGSTNYYKFHTIKCDLYSYRYYNRKTGEEY